MKIYGETSGKNTLQGRAKATADEIFEQLRIRFQDRGWISRRLRPRDQTKLIPDENNSCTHIVVRGTDTEA